MEPDLGELFGRLLRARRKERDLTGYRLGQLADIPPPNLLAIESGQRAPSRANLHALAGVPDLCMSLSEIEFWWVIDRIGLGGRVALQAYLLESQPHETLFAELAGAKLEMGTVEGTSSALSASMNRYYRLLRRIYSLLDPESLSTSEH